MDKKQLLKELQKASMLKTPKIKKAFELIDRADFVLPEYQKFAFENYPLPIGFSQTISQPYTVAFMLNLLKPQTGDKILEIGAGSGWQTALLAYLVGQKGRVIGLERIPELAQKARKNIAKYPKFKKIIKIIQVDGSKGLEKEAPFDKIIAAASAQEIPLEWKEQLAIGGKIVAPVKGSIVVIDKISQNDFDQTEYPGFVFVPLVKDG